MDHLKEGERAGMDKVIRKLEPISDLSPIFAELAYHPSITGPVSEVFGEPVELFEDKLNLKLPGGSPYPWHQDWVCCWRAQTDELVTCFIYLDDADETNGCLQVIPGSHIGKPILPFRPGSRFEVDPACIDHSKAFPAPLKAGHMIFFDSYLLHYSDLNRSSVPRRAIIYTYNPARMGKINEARFPPLRLKVINTPFDNWQASLLVLRLGLFARINLGIRSEFDFTAPLAPLDHSKSSHRRRRNA